ncbi:unnamed protein product [Orchesella dallaii]|uniref:Isopenicillin N synthase-like Fe(2+) 2OG dioxygenase domain-containing protein n=1 Tax=Orchesella dallaii TaxID=48710 RepID=A0ABP1QLR7_9HEXA
MTVSIKKEEPRDFLPSIHAFEKSVKTLLKTFLLLAIGLGQNDTDFFLKTCRNLEEPDKYRSLNILRYIRYPPIADTVNLPPGAVRCAEHSDYGFLTFLLQDDIGGLEVN